MVFVPVPFNKGIMKPIYLMILILSCEVISSCSKDDNDTTKRKENRELLVDKKWVMSSNISIDSLNNQTDLLQDIEDYKKDDYFLFKPDSTYELNDNIELRYDTASVIIDAGKWVLSADGTELLRHSDVFTRTYSPAVIKEITDTSLLLESNFDTDNSKILTRYRKSE